MSKLEELTPNAAVRGIVPDALVSVVAVRWFGSEALELTYKTATGQVYAELQGCSCCVDWTNGTKRCNSSHRD